MRSWRDRYRRFRDRKDGTRTAHVGRQWLGRYGKTDNGIVTVTTVWADERLYYPLHAEPYTPAAHFPKKRADPARLRLNNGQVCHYRQAPRVGAVLGVSRR